jgi:hypothetical protein
MVSSSARRTRTTGGGTITIPADLRLKTRLLTKGNITHGAQSKDRYILTRHNGSPLCSFSFKRQYCHGTVRGLRLDADRVAKRAPEPVISHFHPVSIPHFNAVAKTQ